MLSATHTLISLPFGFYLDHPLIIYISAILLHFIADSFLHWNIFPFQFSRYPYALVAIDVFSGLVLAWIFTGERFMTIQITAAIAGGNTPDVLQELWHKVSPELKRRFPGWIFRLARFHEHIQLETLNVGKGLTWQVIFVVITIFLIRQA